MNKTPARGRHALLRGCGEGEGSGARLLRGDRSGKALSLLGKVNTGQAPPPETLSPKTSRIQSLFRADVTPQVETSTPDFSGQVPVRGQTRWKTPRRLPVSGVQGTALSPIPKMYQGALLHADTPESTVIWNQTPQVPGSWDRAAKVAEQSLLSPPLPVSRPCFPPCASHVMPGAHLPGTDFCLWIFRERPAFPAGTAVREAPYERDPLVGSLG